MTPQEAAHWSRVTAAVIGSYQLWGKRQPKPEYVESLAADLADRSVESLRIRQRRSKGSRS
jgi:hypothetical protein